MATTLSPKSEFATRMGEAYAGLSKSHQKIADFVLQRPLDVVAMSIDAIARECGSSTATITRFVRAVGYDGFSSFREQIVSDYQYVAQNSRADGANSAIDCGVTSLLHQVLADNLQNVADSLANIDPSTVKAFVDALLHCKRIIIIGTGASYYAASYLEEGLALYTEKNVANLLSRGASQYSNNMVRSITPDDTVIAISMPRYSNNAAELTRTARERGATILVLTDNTTSPLAPLAHHVLFAPAKSRLLPNSPAAIFALADALIATMAAERPDIVASTMERLPENSHV